MKVIIVEDEIHNRRMLEGMVRKLRPKWEVVAAFESVKSTVEWLNSNNHPDLIFMDIQLTDGVSFSIFEHVTVESLIIFTTAYDEYAIQAFKVNSIDYLLKPIKEDDLSFAISKFEMAYKYINEEKEQPNYNEILNAIKKGEKKYRQRFLVSGATSLSKISTDDIAFIYSENKLTTAVCFDGKEHIIDYALDKLEEELDPDKFYRANRQYILNIDSVHKIESYFGGKLIVKLIAPFKSTITVSRLKAASFKYWIDQ